MNVLGARQLIIRKPQMKTLFIVCLLSFIVGGSFLSAQEAHTNLRFQLLTIEPGDPVYSLWGHTAIRVIDSENKTDKVWDWGLFEYNSDFVWRYLRGDQDFMVGVRAWTEMRPMYAVDNRRILAQDLLLDPERKAKLIGILLEVKKPENRYYRYDHFLDNCTTRVRDILDDIYFGKVKRRYSDVEAPETFRVMARGKARRDLFIWLGIHLILNTKVDEAISKWEAMFLPDSLMYDLDEMRKQGLIKIGPIRELAEPRFVNANPTAFFLWAALGLFWIIGFGIPMVVTKRWSRWCVLFGSTVWGVLGGIFGTIIGVLTVYSGFATLVGNDNHLAVHPLLFLFPVLALLSEGFLFKNKPLSQHIWKIHFALFLIPVTGALGNMLGIFVQHNWFFLGFALIFGGAASIRSFIVVRAKRAV